MHSNETVSLSFRPCPRIMPAELCWQQASRSMDCSTSSAQKKKTAATRAAHQPMQPFPRKQPVAFVRPRSSGGGPVCRTRRAACSVAAASRTQCAAASAAAAPLCHVKRLAAAQRPLRWLLFVSFCFVPRQNERNDDKPRVQSPVA
jgi:hypothetical protein